MSAGYPHRRSVLRAAPLVLLLVLAVGALRAQDSKDFAVMLRADVSKAPQPRITLHWNRDPFAKAYSIWRKERLDAAWSAAPIAQLDSNATSFTDEDGLVGVGYEYQVYKSCVHRLNDSSQLVYYGSGYIFAGIERAPDELPGSVLLLVDSTMTSPLANELSRLQADLVSEGWHVIVHPVARTENFTPAAVAAVKTVILTEYQKAPANLKSVMLIGRVAVPYSGDINPDGHPDHLGAWPADLYYGDMDGNWTDNRINDVGAGRAENKNAIGDGKFDQSTIPSKVELAIGRIDFYNMPLFTTSETELLRTYLNKDHAFRSGAVVPKLAGVIDDNFSAAAYPEAFSSAAWRAFPLFGSDTTVVAADWFTTLGDSTKKWLWAYGCGGGTYQSAGGIGSTSDFVGNPVNAVFTMLFGSYFGDWDVQNSFLRAPLCTPQAALTSAWVARPQWYMHHMALGETIGYSTVLSQNNASFYIPNAYFTQQYPNGILYTVGNGYVHVALMGDPTLRAQMGPIPKPGALTAIGDTATLTTTLQWAAAAGHVDGYFVYRAVNDTGEYRLVNLTPITGTSFTDTSMRGFEGPTLAVRYLVRGALLHRTASGTYYAGGAVTDESAVQLAGVQSKSEPAFSFEAVPNPASHVTSFMLSLSRTSNVAIDVYDMAGHLVRHLIAEPMNAGSTRVAWDLGDQSGARVPAGVYVAKLTASGRSETRKIVVAP